MVLVSLFYLVSFSVSIISFSSCHSLPLSTSASIYPARSLSISLVSIVVSKSLSLSLVLLVSIVVSRSLSLSLVLSVSIVVSWSLSLSLDLSRSFSVSLGPYRSHSRFLWVSDLLLCCCPHNEG